MPCYYVLQFLPGQWLDVYLPTLPKPGGFTITSTPSQALDKAKPYLELAVQRSPNNPAAAWLWQPVDVIQQSTIHVRVGGSFVWPPQNVDLGSLGRVIFVAGGVGVNPLISMLSSLAESAASGESSLEIHVLYSQRDPAQPPDARRMLFVERIADIFSRRVLPGKFRLFLTGGERQEGERDGNAGFDLPDGVDVPVMYRRISIDDITRILDGEKESAVVYICGVPAMTDEFVDKLVNDAGMDPRRVLCEKWW